MKKQRITMLWGLLFCGALALSMTQAAQAVEMNGGIYPDNYCFTCAHPIWG